MPRKVGAFAKVCGGAWRPVAVICLLVYLAVNQMIFNLGWLEREKGNRCTILRRGIMLDTPPSFKPPRCSRGGFLIRQFISGTFGLPLGAGPILARVTQQAPLILGRFQMSHRSTLAALSILTAKIERLLRSIISYLLSDLLSGVFVFCKTRSLATLLRVRNEFCSFPSKLRVCCGW